MVTRNPYGAPASPSASRNPYGTPADRAGGVTRYPFGEPARRTAEPPNRTRTLPNYNREEQRTPYTRSGEPPNQTRTLPDYNREPAADFSDWLGDGGGSSGSSGGGGVSIPGAGGAGGSISAPTVSAGTNGQLSTALGELDAARASAQNELSGLDARFAEQRDLLREEYSFAETQEEKARLAFMLGDLENQRLAAADAIADGYERTVASIEERGEAMRASGAQEAQAVGDLYRDAQASLGATQQQVSADAAASAEGLGVGAAGPSGAAADWVGLLAAAAPREQALAANLANNSAGEADWLAMMGGLEGEAQQAQLSNNAMQSRNQGIMQHSQQVEQRLQQERAQWRDQLAQLQSMFQQRGFDLGDQDRTLQAQGGEMRFSAGESAAQRGLQASMANAQAQLDAAKANQSASLARARINQSAASARAAAARTPSGPSAQERFLDAIEARQAAGGIESAVEMGIQMGVFPEGLR